MGIFGALQSQVKYAHFYSFGAVLSKIATKLGKNNKKYANKHVVVSTLKSSPIFPFDLWSKIFE